MEWAVLLVVRKAELEVAEVAPPGGGVCVGIPLIITYDIYVLLHSLKRPDQQPNNKQQN